MNARTRTLVVAFIASTALIVPLAGCAGTALVADPKAETRVDQDVAERRLWMQTRVDGRDVAERRLWMQSREIGPDVAERRLWMLDGS
ncbi:hypothetical protein [Agromyces sp. NPDC057865]|uniref:hypothetical protein n=1 Tax=Agromyces sp. NPDC057865 TaxID=3346267 RepID=UPI003672DDE1